MKIIKLIKNPYKIYNFLALHGRLKSMPDAQYIRNRYRAHFGKKLNLDDPKTYSEKLQWLKLYDRRPEYTTMVDKYAVKAYVESIIGKTYTIPMLGVWERFDDIDFDSLPNRFVLKCTHDSGGVVICRDKEKLDKQEAKRIIEKSLRRDYYAFHREWPYKNVKRRIIAEVFMEDEKLGELRDYKFFCFNGEAKAMFIASERQKPGEEVKFDFFDMDFNHLNLRQGHPNAEICPEKPATFDEMKGLAEKLSQGIPHVRVDFYEVNGKAYFGEMTFFHFSGFVPFEPAHWDDLFGEWITLPSKKIMS